MIVFRALLNRELFSAVEFETDKENEKTDTNKQLKTLQTTNEVLLTFHHQFQSKLEVDSKDKHGATAHFESLWL